MKKWQKFILRFLGFTIFLFSFYKIGWPNYMSNIEYLAMSGVISLLVGGIITYGDDLSKKIDG
jgi:hypothetical protein